MSIDSDGSFEFKFTCTRGPLAARPRDHNGDQKVRPHVGFARWSFRNIVVIENDWRKQAIQLALILLFMAGLKKLDKIVLTIWRRAGGRLAVCSSWSLQKDSLGQTLADTFLPASQLPRPASAQCQFGRKKLQRTLPVTRSSSELYIGGTSIKNFRQVRLTPTALGACGICLCAPCAPPRRAQRRGERRRTLADVYASPDLTSMTLALFLSSDPALTRLASALSSARALETLLPAAWYPVYVNSADVEGPSRPYFPSTAASSSSTANSASSYTTHRRPRPVIPTSLFLRARPRAAWCSSRPGRIYILALPLAPVG
ncbi:hypothetical protein DFH06DRAFT_1121567 [Mycena polygramma]|nr:hypothetical protein DFH06DRAFT_1121567 [Mycena polygramma]